MTKVIYNRCELYECTIESLFYFSYYLLTLKKSKRLITKSVRLDRWIGGGGIEINSHIKRF